MTIMLLASAVLVGCGSEDRPDGSPRAAAVLMPVAGSQPATCRGVFVARRGGINPADPIVAVRTCKRLVALTFDDGPDPRWTPAILRELARGGAQATFFTIGRRVDAHPRLARRIVRLGNEVGNHTLTHPRLLELTAAEVRREVVGGREALGRAGLPRPTFFRPPRGAFDAEVTGVVAANNERTIGWDIPLDRDLRGRAVKVGAERTAARVRPGSIILAHDGGGRVRGRTVRAIPWLLASLRRRGYRVVTVGTLLRAAGVSIGAPREGGGRS